VLNCLVLTILRTDDVAAVAVIVPTFLRLYDQPLRCTRETEKGQPGTSVSVGSAGGWGCFGFVYLQPFLGVGGIIISKRGARGGAHVSARESQGSTTIARQAPIDRVSQKTRNSVIPRRASRNSREFDAQSFLATIGEGRKAILFPKKHTIFTQGDPADAVFYLQTGKARLTVVSKVWQGSDDRHIE
jgi:hypothetical protein